MENNQYYSCFKYYSSKKRRLACFGRKINDNELEIFIEECDRKDTFTKRFAKDIYQQYLSGFKEQEYVSSIKEGGSAVVMTIKIAHPQIFTIPLNGKHPKQVFLSYLRDNYLIQFPVWKRTSYTYATHKELEVIYQVINNLA